MKVLKCPVCGTVKQTLRSRRFCSHKCDIASRDRAKLQAQGRKAGAKSGETRRRQSLERWQRLYPGVPYAAVTAIYAQGYNSGHRAGYANGFSAAIGERKPRKAA